MWRPADERVEISSLNPTYVESVPGRARPDIATTQMEDAYSVRSAIRRSDRRVFPPRRTPADGAPGFSVQRSPTTSSVAGGVREGRAGTRASGPPPVLASWVRAEEGERMSFEWGSKKVLVTGER